MSTIFDPSPCVLGEGPLWHPTRNQLFWFDILGKRLLTHTNGKTQHWDMGECASAAGWLDDDRLFIASESAFFTFDVTTGAREDIAPLQTEDIDLRSNDGRADPWGGFWIGTMSKVATPGRGAIWRYYKGEIRQLFPGITIPNGIAFAPDGSVAYFTDTMTRVVHRVALGDPDGWPIGEVEDWLDLRSEGLNPDGAVVDAAGNYWNAQWGAHRVVCYSPSGRLIETVPFDAPNTSCPAFGGQDLTTLYCTTARELLDPAQLAAHPDSGKTFVAEEYGPGLPEHRVVL